MTEFSLTTIDFHGDSLYAVEREDGIFVPPKPISDRLGLNWRSQLNRLRRDSILNEGVVIMTTAFAGSRQEMTLLRLDLMNGWLFGIDDSRVNPEYLERILTYKRECYRVLFQHFYKGKLDAPAQRAAMTDDIKLRRINTAIRCFGGRAGAELWAEYGFELTPAMKAALAQKQFSFVVDLDESGPTEPAAVN